MSEQNNITDELRTLSLALEKIMKQLFVDKSRTKISKAEINRKEIIEFRHCMRIFGLEKYHMPTVISTLNYYLNGRDRARQNAFGALLVYVDLDEVIEILRLLGEPVEMVSDEDELLGCGGKIVGIVGGAMKEAMASVGYGSLEVGNPWTIRNSSNQGAPFYQKKKEKDEISFYIGEKKRLVIEINMGPMAKSR